MGTPYTYTRYRYKPSHEWESRRDWQNGTTPAMNNSRMRMIHFCCLLLCWMAFPLQGLEIFDQEEVEYINSNTTATVGGSVILECGSTMPAIFIWGFTKQGTDNNVAVAYNYGQGPKIQSQSSRLGLMQVQVNTSALVIEELQRVAEGTYTCQALYDTDNGAKTTFYFHRLDMMDD
ncbi:uncharacterized protein AB9W97_007073 isoform 1-T1 [Spinachia spinachia]